MRRMNYLRFISLTFVMSMLFSCSTKIKYIGNVYEPSQDVKLFFDDKDIVNEHEVMGRIYVKFKERKNIEAIQRTIV